VAPSTARRHLPFSCLRRRFACSPRWFGVAVVVAVGIVAFNALRNPKEMVLTDADKTDVLEKANKSDKLSAEDKELMTAFVARAEAPPVGSAAPATWKNKTVAGVIEEQRKWIADQKAEAARKAALLAEAKAKRDKLHAELMAAVDFRLSSKELIAADPYGITQNIVLQATFKNTSPTDIRAFAGPRLQRLVRAKNHRSGGQGVGRPSDGS
jgi:hypothetical protein